MTRMIVRGLKSKDNERMILELYEWLEHGDDQHRSWLKNAIQAFFYGNPKPAPDNLPDWLDEQEPPRL
jgi:hypothetical protein